MSDNKKVIYRFTRALREYYQDGRLDDSQIARLESIGFSFTATTKRRVVCLETGTQYESVKAAAEAVSRKHCTLVNALRSHTHYSTGYHWMYADEYEKMSEEEIAHILTLGRRNVVVCLETGVWYESAAAAAKEIGCCDSIIGKACKQESHYAYGKHWMFEDEYSRLSDEEITHVLTLRAGMVVRPVVCLETGVRYKNGGDAERAVGCRCGGIVVQAAKSEKHYAAGFHWMFEDEYKKLSDEEVARILTLRRYRPVVCLETGVKYESAGEAAEATKILNSSIVGACKKETHYTGGYHWMYADEYEKMSEEEIAHILTLGAPVISKSVVCLETGVRYKSAGEAGRVCGVKGIAGACKRKYHHSGGYHWMYADEYDLLSCEEIAHILTLGNGYKKYKEVGRG